MVRIFTQWTLLLRIHERFHPCGTRGVIWVFILLLSEQQDSLIDSEEGNKTQFVSLTFLLALSAVCLLEQNAVCVT